MVPEKIFDFQCAELFLEEHIKNAPKKFTFDNSLKYLMLMEMQKINFTLQLIGENIIDLRRDEKW